MTVWRSWLVNEGHDVEATPRGLIHVAQRRLMVADDGQLELRRVSEEVAPHEARRNRVATSHLFDTRFGPGSTRFRLRGGYQACTAQHREISRMLVVVRGGERFHSRDRRVVLHDPACGVQINALSVAARTIDEQESVFGRDAGQAVAAPLLKEADKRDIIVSRLPEEIAPERATAVVRRHCGRLGDSILRRAGAQLAGSQINRAARRSEQPRIAIPVFAGDSNRLVVLREAFDAR